MGNGYVRQSAADIVQDAVINAAPLNAEFNAIRDAFDGTQGHSHDGTVGEGQQIDLTTAVTGVLPEANGGTGINNVGTLIAGKANKAGDTFTGPIVNTTALTVVDPTSQTAYPLSVWSNSNRGASGSNNLSGVGLNISNFSPSIRLYDRTASSLSSVLITDNSNFAIFAENAAGTEWTSMFQVNLANGQAFLGANRIIDAPQLAAHTSLTNNPHSVTAAQVGLGNVNNTSDADKPVSTATTTALALKANLASPTLTGNPTAPTQAVNNNSTRIATTAYADRAATNAGDAALAAANAKVIQPSDLAPTVPAAVNSFVLVGSWGGATLGGLTNITIDLPTEFSMFKFIETDLRSTDANAAFVIRTGFTAGGAVDSGANDYSNLIFGFSGGGTNFSGAYSSANWAYIRTITTVSGRSEGIFSRGEWGIQWGMQLQSSEYTNNRDSTVNRVVRRNASTSDIKRFQFGFNAPLVNGGQIRLYGIK